MTVFHVLVIACGLSHREAASLLSTRLDTIRKWSSGDRCAPPVVQAELAAWEARIERAAAKGVDLAASNAAKEIELGLCADDREATTLGWPCVGMHGALVGRVAARLIERGFVVRVVPRNTTIAMVGAVDAHDGA